MVRPAGRSACMVGVVVSAFFCNSVEAGVEGPRSASACMVGVVVSAFFCNSVEAGVEGPRSASALDRLRKNPPTHTAQRR